MGFSRQESWSGLPFPPAGDLPNPGIKPSSPILQEDSLLSEPPGKLRVSGEKSYIPELVERGGHIAWVLTLRPEIDHLLFLT